MIKIIKGIYTTEVNCMKLIDFFINFAYFLIFSIFKCLISIDILICSKFFIFNLWDFIDWKIDK